MILDKEPYEDDSVIIKIDLPSSITGDYGYDITSLFPSGWVADNTIIEPIRLYSPAFSLTYKEFVSLNLIIYYHNSQTWRWQISANTAQHVQNGILEFRVRRIR
jgi:hypothetical protein